MICYPFTGDRIWGFLDCTLYVLYPCDMQLKDAIKHSYPQPRRWTHLIAQSATHQVHFLLHGMYLPSRQP
jgi:hypothetical protein